MYNNDHLTCEDGSQGISIAYALPEAVRREWRTEIPLPRAPRGGPERVEQRKPPASGSQRRPVRVDKRKPPVLGSQRRSGEGGEEKIPVLGSQRRSGEGG